jgi:hypothetical protein
MTFQEKNMAEVQRLANGNLRVPVGARQTDQQTGKNIQVDGFKEITPADPSYHGWIEWLERHERALRLASGSAKEA